MQRAARDGDAGVDLQALAWDDGGDVPVASARTSSECSAPGSCSCTSSVPSRSRRLELVAALDEPNAARPAAATRGLTIAGSAIGDGSNAVVDDDRRAGTRTVPAQCSAQRPLVQARRAASPPRPARARRRPAANPRARSRRAGAARCRPSGRARRRRSRRQRSQQLRRRSRGSSPRRQERPPRSGATRYRPAAYGSMSAASIVTGSPSIARRTETADGPPAPVTSTRAAGQRTSASIPAVSSTGAASRAWGTAACRCRGRPRAARRSGAWAKRPQ